MIIRVNMTNANQNNSGPMDDGGVIPDHVQPFMLDQSQLRGRIVRLPSVINDVIAAHHYPEPIARLLGEALCLTTLLAGMLKFDGIFTLQAKCNGAIKSIVCDMTNDGTLRGYIGFYGDVLETLKENDFVSMTRGGYLAFTVDQAQSNDRTQGITPLEGDTLTTCVRDYFIQSEQINTGILSFIDRDENGHWQGGALMLQELPREGTLTSEKTTAEDDWQRAMVLMQTAQKSELLDAGIPLNTLLYRLFHEENVRVFDPLPIKKGCRCTIEKIYGVLENLSDSEKAELAEEGVIKVTCEFCNTTYNYPVEKPNA